MRAIRTMSCSGARECVIVKRDKWMGQVNKQGQGMGRFSGLMSLRIVVYYRCLRGKKINDFRFH